MRQNSSNIPFYKSVSLMVGAIVLSSVLAAPATAQSNQHDAVLSAGKPTLTASMINRLVNLFEWSLDVKFTMQDRAALERQVVSYWKNGDAKAMQSVKDSLAFEQNLAHASAEKRQEVQPQIQQKLLEIFESDSRDGLNRLLLAIYRRSRDQQSAVNDASDSTNSLGANLAGLAGKWQVLHGNSIVGVDRNTGRIGDGNAMIAEFDFRPDGRVVYSFALQQSNYGCTTRIKTSKAGRAVVEGSRITFAYDTGATTSEDSCNVKYNYTKSVPPSRETFDFGLKNENGKTQFCFANDKLKDCAVKVK